jgi:hypothetical protein
MPIYPFFLITNRSVPLADPECVLMANASELVGSLQPLSDIPYALLAVVQPKNIDVKPVLFVVEVGCSFRKGSVAAEVLWAFLTWSNSVGFDVPIPVSEPVVDNLPEKFLVPVIVVGRT